MSIAQTVKTGLTLQEAKDFAVVMRKQNRIAGVYHDGTAWCVEVTCKYPSSFHVPTFSS